MTKIELVYVAWYYGILPTMGICGFLWLFGLKKRRWETWEEYQEKEHRLKNKYKKGITGGKAS